MKKEIQVVMLPTEKANKCIAIQYFEDGTKSMDFWEDACIREYPQEGFTEYDANCIVPQHLYFLSDEEIKEGDWFYNKLLNKIFKANKSIVAETLNVLNCKKIIATTDPELNKQQIFDGEFFDSNVTPGLPRPSNEFVQKYCELGGIDKVLVDYKYNCCAIFKFGECCGEDTYEPKLAPDNTISIYPIES